MGEVSAIINIIKVLLYKIPFPTGLNTPSLGKNTNIVYQCWCIIRSFVFRQHQFDELVMSLSSCKTHRCFTDLKVSDENRISLFRREFLNDYNLLLEVEIINSVHDGVLKTKFTFQHFEWISQIPLFNILRDLQIICLNQCQYFILFQ